MERKTRIVILGGGFAGTSTALRLERTLGRDQQVEITLIDSENFFTFTPLLPEVPSGSIQPKHIVFPLRALLRKTIVRQAGVHAIDLARREVVAAHCHACGAYRIPFDHLVVALGSVPNYFNLPGVAEHSLTIKSLADATRLHAHVIDKLEHADLTSDHDAKRRMLTFVVAGGGFAGVETLAELNDFVRGAGRFYPGIAPQDIRLVLIHSGQRILPEVNEGLSKYALAKLQQYGVEAFLGVRVAERMPGAVRLSDGTVIPSDTFVWAAGTAPHALLDGLDVPKNAAGRIEVDAAMAIPGMPGLWAIGDSAAIPDLVTGKMCPPTAQYAIRQGRRLADNISATIAGRPTTPFRFKSLGLLAGLGRRSAVAEILGMRFSGFFAWWLWRTIYLMKLPGMERKLRVCLDWTMDLFFPRDIVYLRPLHDIKGAGPVSRVEHDSGEMGCDGHCELPRHEDRTPMLIEGAAR